MKPGLDNLLKSFLNRKSLKIYFKDRGNLKPMLQLGLIFLIKPTTNSYQ